MLFGAAHTEIGPSQLSRVASNYSSVLCFALFDPFPYSLPPRCYVWFYGSMLARSSFLLGAK